MLGQGQPHTPMQHSRWPVAAAGLGKVISAPVDRVSRECRRHRIQYQSYRHAGDSTARSLPADNGLKLANNAIFGNVSPTLTGIMTGIEQSNWRPHVANNRGIIGLLCLASRALGQQDQLWALACVLRNNWLTDCKVRYWHLSGECTRRFSYSNNAEADDTRARGLHNLTFAMWVGRNSLMRMHWSGQTDDEYQRRYITDTTDVHSAGIQPQPILKSIVHFKVICQ